MEPCKELNNIPLGGFCHGGDSVKIAEVINEDFINFTPSPRAIQMLMFPKSVFV